MNNNRFRLGNKNREDESQQIEELLAESDLSKEKLAYLRKRYVDTIFVFDRLAIENKVIFQVARSIVLIIGILIPALVNIDSSIIPEKSSKIIVTVLSVLSSILFGVLQIWKNDSMWAHHRLQFEHMKSELYRFLTLSGDKYGQFSSHSEAFKHFTAIAEDKFDRQIEKYFDALQLRSKRDDIYEEDNNDSNK
jgi:hypothetical protein